MMSSAHAACDAAQAHAAKSHVPATRRPRLVLLTTILASSLAFVDGSVVNVGLPAIGRDMDGGPADLQWVVNAYLLPLSALLLLGGALGDRFGRQRLLIIGTVLFALSSVACALAPTLPWLLLARGLQGVGAALLMPNSLAILGGAFSGEARGRAIGIWASAGSITGAAGPLLGGVLIDSIGWRSIFLINIPLAAAAIWLALCVIPNGPRSAKSKPLDIAGAGLATLALGGLTWGLTMGSGKQGWTVLALAGAAAGLLLFLAFLWLENRLGDRAMMPLVLFGSRSFIGLSLLTLLLYGALGGLLVLLPYLLIQAAGYSATLAGAALLPFPLVLTVLSPVMGGVAGRFGPRWPLTIGPIIVAAGLLLMLRISAAGSYWTTILPSMLVISLGMACATAPLTTAVLTSVDARHTGFASGLNSALARAGGLIATALLGAVLIGRGAALISGFHGAAILGALACAAAGLCALLLFPGAKAKTKPRATSRLAGISKAVGQSGRRRSA
jgi:EmrB/QacA subfamily drug resistance transporter